MLLDFFIKSKPVSKSSQNETLTYEEWVFRIHRRASFRGMKLSVSRNTCLNIFASKGAHSRDIMNFIKQYEDWIRKKLVSGNFRLEKYTLKLGLQGEDVYFLGSKRKIFHKKTSLKKVKVSVFGSQMLIEHCGVSQSKILESIRLFYKNESEKILPEVVKIRSREMGLEPQKVIFRAQKTLWGSCSSSGTLSLNWKLSMAPLKTIDYVVVHELAHIKFQNHSKDFWNLVEQVLPDYKIYSKWLRDHHYDFDWLSQVSSLHCSKNEQMCK